MLTFATDYYLFILVASFGVIQLGASLGGLRGLLIVKNDLVTRAFGVVLAVVAAFWFFDPATRNINDYEGGLDANQQAIFFLLGTVSAFLLTVAVSSVVNARMKGPTPEPGAGLEDLKQASFTIASIRNIRFWLREWRTQTKSYFSG
jgi:hypothetical protein